jgi:hypothetical protein
VKGHASVRKGERAANQSDLLYKAHAKKKASSARE